MERKRVVSGLLGKQLPPSMGVAGSIPVLSAVTTVALEDRQILVSCTSFENWSPLTGAADSISVSSAMNCKSGKCPSSVAKAQKLRRQMGEVLKYKVGTKVVFGNEDPLEGRVIENFKLPGDVCVQWLNGPNGTPGEKSSYDREWLDENVKIVP